MVNKMSEIERNERIAKDIMFELEFLKEKLLETSEYIDKILFRAQQVTHSKCEYRFDEYPYIISQKIYEDGSYVAYEDAVDEIRCENHVINIETERVEIEIGKISLLLILKVRKVEVKRRE
jgi:hypothetical protein